MLKNKGIIDNLSISQKLSILAGTAIEQHEFCKIIPAFNVANLHDLNVKSFNNIVYPSFNSMSTCWDSELISCISKELALRNKNDITSAVITSELGIKTNIYSIGMSEDPYLGGKFASAYVKGIINAGMMPILANCSVSERDAEFMDLDVNKYIIRDYITKPFETALKENGGCAIMTSFKKLKGNYHDINLRLAREILHDNRFFRAHIICGTEDDDLGVASMYAGNTFSFKGNVRSLEEAYNNYLRMKESLEKGLITTKELENACINGMVLSEEAINNAVDRYIDFAFECEKCIKKIIDDELPNAVVLSIKASEESIVLLKNVDKVLPIKADAKVAVIGQLAALSQKNDSLSFIQTMSEGKENLSFEYVGYAEGYNINEERNDTLINEACTLASESDVVLLFLGFDKDREMRMPDAQCVRLPANQLALTDLLGKTGKKIVAVIAGECAYDLNFDEDCLGLILIPSGGTYTYDALLKTLKGEINPSGKLSYTFYDEPNNYFHELKKNKDLGKIKIGQFFGYRRYDIADMKVKYPFGHGLSYTTFSYSGLKASADGIQFKIKNTGDVGGYETSQVYIGKNNSKVLRPAKELKSYSKIYLEPGESKVIKIDLDYNDFYFCDPADGERKVEQGEYTAYIGVSVSDIRLKKSFNVFGQEFIGEKENLSDYIQIKSNIVDEGYTLETIKTPKIQLSKIGIISIYTLIIAGLYDIILFTINSFKYISSISAIIIFYLTLLLLPAAVIALIIDIVKYRKRLRLNTKRIKENNIRENETIISEKIPLEKMFFEEFKEITDVNEKQKNQLEEDIAGYINKDVKMNDEAVKLETFMTDHGLILNSSSVREILSAMFSSRMMILKSADLSLLENLLQHLCSYLGTPAFIDNSDNTLECIDQLLFIRKENEGYDETSIAKAITLAAQNKHLIHIAAIKGIKLSQNEKLLMPFVSYAANPEKEHKIILNDKNISDKNMIIPSNLWLVLMLSDSDSLDDIPQYVSKNAAVIDIKIRKTQENNENTVMCQLNFHQFIKLGNNSEKTHALSENMWKKFDKVENYVNSHIPYHIGNKEWRRIEKYISVYLACEGTEAEAVDSVIASKLLPEIIPLIKANPYGNDSDFSIVLEKILGEDNAAACLDVVKSFGRVMVSPSKEKEA